MLGRKEEHRGQVLGGKKDRTAEAAYLAGSWYRFMSSLKIQLSINNECLLSTEYHAGSRDTEGIRKWTTMSLHGTGPRRKPTKGPDSQWQYEAREDSQERASDLTLDMSSHTKNKRGSIWAGSQMCVMAQRQESPLVSPCIG